MKYKTGIFIGRFQPFHKGHLKVIKLLQSECENIIICIGSAQYKHESKNPLSCSQRRTIIKALLKARNISAKLISVDDTPSDDDWMDALLKTKFNALYSSNLWVLKIARAVKRERNAQIEIIDMKPLVDSDQTRDISATRIRASIRGGTASWKRLVPNEIKEVIEQKYLKNFIIKH